MSNDTHGAKGEKWIGFDLDGTIAEYNGWKGIAHIGKPIKPMCDVLNKLHADGKKVKILTARVAPRDEGGDPAEARRHIEIWCKQYLGFVPEITHEKDSCMEYLYDDRAIQVIPNKGITVEEGARAAIEGENGETEKALREWLDTEND